ncbi:ORF13 [Fowl aviadenovirus E]|uniref:ORF13 n=2 Tax=Fowl aviadenovirus E TaxID=190065 RepID=A0A650C0H0_9ADEN|nr:ORF13 [Fowl aviadenovirus E]QGQ62795.1 ORF13 [Fowl aviadenovirus E]QGQ62830.1 ORF13 [Fowl aviadenovirus E]QGQ62900.1 ORF13 [Fowl aviadenovirus E]QGQ62936.1 ORF13 [Fowl aviadenovirus E]
MIISSLFQTKRKSPLARDVTSDDDDASAEAPPTPSFQTTKTPRTSPTRHKAPSAMEALVEKLFRDGIAHQSQWDEHVEHQDYHLRPEEKECVIAVLRDRFGSHRSLYAQLPTDNPDSLRLAFYNPDENWFHQVLEKEGYDAALFAITLRKWLDGDINTLVLCGSRLSNAKLLYNVLLSCFPLAISDGDLNDTARLAAIAPHTSLYCVPFVETQPSTLTLHFMEGNSGTCYIHEKPVFVRAPQMLIHCSNVSIAYSFMCRNASILFLTAPHDQTPTCLNPRRELKDFISTVTHTVSCGATMHCKRDSPLCQICGSHAVRSPEF